MVRITFISLILAAILASCQSQAGEKAGQPVNVNGGTYFYVTPADLNDMLKSKDFLFVNVHIPFEGDIADTDLSIPYDQISEPSNLALLPADKEAKVVLYCRSGRMSTLAAETLVDLGYTNVWNLAGGMLDWERAGYEIER